MKWHLGKDGPFGVVAGALFIGVFYITLGYVVSLIILNGVASQTHTSVGMFDNWWQVLLFVFDIILAVAFILALALRFWIKPREAKPAVNKVKNTKKVEAKPSFNQAHEEEIIATINKYQKLLESGAITKKEFEKKKKELIG